MNCVLFAKMDQVFSLKKQDIKKILEKWKKFWKNQGKVREFCQSGKVGTTHGYSICVRLFCILENEGVLECYH